MAKRYFKRRWDEPRGDERDSWGSSWWFFECNEAGELQRQVEDYDSGPTLLYDEKRWEGRYGGLGDQPLDLIEFATFETEPSVFEEAWRRAEFVPNASEDDA